LRVTCVRNGTENPYHNQHGKSNSVHGTEDRQVKFESRFSEQGSRDVCFGRHLLHVSTMGRDTHRTLGRSSSRNLAHGSDRSKCCLYSLFQPASWRPSSCP